MYSIKFITLDGLLFQYITCILTRLQNILTENIHVIDFHCREILKYQFKPCFSFNFHFS
jgi:hypothetical protein